MDGSGICLGWRYNSWMEAKGRFEPYRQHQLLVLPPGMRQQPGPGEAACLVMDVAGGPDVSEVFGGCAAGKAERTAFDLEMMTGPLLWLNARRRHGIQADVTSQFS